MSRDTVMVQKMDNLMRVLTKRMKNLVVKKIIFFLEIFFRFFAAYSRSFDIKKLVSQKFVIIMKYDMFHNNIKIGTKQRG